MNHFRWNDYYTTKGGLSKNLKNLIGKGYNIDNFFPKSYDLNDQVETEDFLGIILIFRGIQIQLSNIFIIPL